MTEHIKIENDGGILTLNGAARQEERADQRDVRHAGRRHRGRGAIPPSASC